MLVRQGELEQIPTLLDRLKWAVANDCFDTFEEWRIC
jgi:hypothetical protein